MIIEGRNYYILNTENTSYVFRVTPSGHLEHLYYGSSIKVTDDLDGLTERYEFMFGNNISYSEDFSNMTLNDLCLEASFEGKGDNREAFLIVENADESRTSDFVFEKASVNDEKRELRTMPCSYYEDEKPEHLEVILKDKYNKLRLHIDYYVFEKENVITRTARLVNHSDKAVKIKQIMSGMLDLHESGYVMSTFNGAWTREMSRKDNVLVSGKHINSSYTGVSSNVANPFFMISTPYTTEDSGQVYGFNLIYSGNHAEIAEVNEFGKTRILWGINPKNFCWNLEAKHAFEAPEAVMTFSENGFNEMSHNMHDFVKNHITRGKWAKQERPVLLNSWEAAYFDINEDKLLKLAKAGKDIGIELFVMDDGWFGKRNDDTSSLGDWVPNKKKLPEGIKGIADKVNELGLKFGIWVEPEMVNVKSTLYEKHPEWVIQIPDKPHSEGRNQRILDLGRPEVQQYIIKSMTKVFSSANIEYVKWDMNRNMSDIYSLYLAEKGNGKQGELCHRYVLGLYKCMKVLTERFPDILFEGCASGGNRFDLGILSYFPQIWGSDDTDAIVRAEIQSGYSYGYPQSCWGSHISGVPNHQTLRNTPLATRYSVAVFGSLGVECNIKDMSQEDKKELKEYIEMYKKFRCLFQFGDFFRGRTFTGATKYAGITQGVCGANSVLTATDSNITEWTVVAPDKTKAVGMLLQKLTVPNMAYQYYRARGLDAEKLYHFYNVEHKVNIKEFGDLVNMVAPVHIKPGSLTQNIVAKHYKLDGDKEDFNIYGSALMNAGVKLSPAYTGTGFNENTRVFSDFGTRIYFMEEEL